MIWRRAQTSMLQFLDWIDHQWAQAGAIQQRIDEQREKIREHSGPQFPKY